MGEMSRGDVSVLKDDSLIWSKVLALFEPHLKEAPFFGVCGDILLGSDAPNIDHINPICYELFDLTPVSSPLLPTIPLHLHAYHESLCDIRGYISILCIPRGRLTKSCEVPSLILLVIFFMEFDEFKRPLTFFTPSFLVFSYSHYSEMPAITYDKPS